MEILCLCASVLEAVEAHLSLWKESALDISMVLLGAAIIMLLLGLAGQLLPNVVSFALAAIFGSLSFIIWYRSQPAASATTQEAKEKRDQADEFMRRQQQPRPPSGTDGEKK